MKMQTESHLDDESSEGMTESERLDDTPSSPPGLGARLSPLLVWTVPLLVLDQLTKWMVLKSFFLFETRPVIPGFFNLVRVHNDGAAFGMFQGKNVFFVALAGVASAVIVGLLATQRVRERLTRAACGVLLAGVLGNLIDRLVHGYVIDFLDFHVAGHHWPAFNVADSAICVSVGLIVLASFAPMSHESGK